jgi:hypothetical protein
VEVSGQHTSNTLAPQRYSSVRRLGGSQSQSGHGGEEVNPVTAGNQNLTAKSITSCFTD